jgi:hypothetical protein
MFSSPRPSIFEAATILRRRNVGKRLKPGRALWAAQ